MKKIYLASANKHKLEEIAAILSPLGFEVLCHPEYAALQVEETGRTFEENASIKAEALSRLTGALSLADDSGISVDALGGAPGVFSARYAGESATDEENNHLLLENLRGVENRKAAFVCALALADGGKTFMLFRGECKGQVAEQPAGHGGFGYDPLFLLPDRRTMAELSPDEKNALSHRRQALDKLAAYLRSQAKT